MFDTHSMYYVSWSVGSGMHKGPGFRRYDDALRYVEEHKGGASFVIRKPDGEFVQVTKRDNFLVDEIVRVKAPRPLSHAHKDYLHRLSSKSRL